jgi:iron complex outermembrane receptor protein
MKNKAYVAAGLMAGVLGSAHSQQAPVQPAATAGGGLEEVIVTAARREQSVQTASLDISVVGGESLARAGVTQATDLGSVVPGLSVATGGSAVSTYLRGVGNQATDASAESAIAYSINGVYIARPSGIGSVFFDLERVEVLKGPQGTLYGRNATGGAINLITRQPTQEFSGEVSVDVGNYDLHRFTGAVSGGVTDTLSLRFAGQYSKHDGYLTDGYDDEDSRSGRLTALWKPNDAVKLLITGEFTNMDPKGDATVALSSLRPMPSDPWAGPSVGNAEQPPNAAIPGGTRIADNGFNDTNISALSANLNVDLGGADLTFIPAYRYTRVAYLTYTPGFYFDTNETSKEQSYELRLGKDTNAIKWVTGLYYFNEDQGQLYNLQAVPFQEAIVNTPLHTRSYAAFGDVTYSVAEALRVIGGLRYSDDKKTQGGSTTSILPTQTVTENTGERDFRNVSWRTGLEYDLAVEHMLFATAATGFKSGGFFPSVPAPNNSFGPEKLLAYTLGSRNRFLERRLQLNLEGFYWKYRDKQEKYLGATPAGTTGLLTANAGRATLYGADIDLQFKATSRDTVRTSVEYLHTRYDSFVYNVYNPSVSAPFVNSYAPQATGCAIGPVVPYTLNDFVPALRYDSTQQINCSGKPLVHAPDWTGSVGYDHLFNLPGSSTLTASVDAQFASSQYLSPDFIQSGTNAGYAVLNSTIAWRSANDWVVSVWGRNLTDKAIYTGGGRYAFTVPVQAGGDPTLFYSSIRPPRTYGLSVGKSF